MPKRVTTTELQRIEDELLRHPEGLPLLQLQKELGGSISRRTLSRRISALLKAGRTRDSVSEPDRFRMRYREALTEVVGQIIRAKQQPSADTIRARAQGIVDAQDMPKFVELTSLEFRRLSEFNIARYRLRLAEYRDWCNALRGG
jgi:DNA-binding transcriptional ArsR family regulator